MVARQGTQVTLTIPEGAPPGTLLSVPVRGGTESIKVRVPDGLGAGSTMILTQADGSEEWNMQVKTVVPLPDDQPGTQAVSPEAGGSYGGPTANDHAMAPYQPPDPQPSAGLEAHVAYTVRLDTTVGVIDIIVRPDWAPHGTRRFLDLAHSGDLSELAFYRAIKGCIVQFGLPAKRPWPPIPDDPPTGVPFLLGAVSFAAIGENTRRSTLFICIGDMSHMLGQKSWETPIGAVAESSLDVLENIDTSYGDIAEFGGCGPDTNRINNEGNGYLQSNFPNLSYINSAWPLDWTPEQEDPSLGVPQLAASPAPLPTQLSQVPPVQDGDQAVLAAQAAREAQIQAQQAAEAAQRAQQAQDVAAAAQAAQMAQQAARAAAAAAERAQAAQQAAQQAAHTNKAGDTLGFSRSPMSRPAAAETAPVVRSAPPMYPGSTDLGGFPPPWTQPGTDTEPVDVPVEVRPRVRTSHPPPVAQSPVSPVPRAGSFAKIGPGGAPMSALGSTVTTPLGNSVGFSSVHPVGVQSSLGVQVSQVPSPHVLHKPGMVPQVGGVMYPGFNQMLPLR